MIGAVIGDIIGSHYEFLACKNYDFTLFMPDSNFTDDTIFICSVADAIKSGKPYKDKLIEWCNKYPIIKGGYGLSFQKWLNSSDKVPYLSFGNGAGVRGIATGFLFDDLETVKQQARLVVDFTHNHPEGIKGAEAVATVVYLIRMGESKEYIEKYVTEHFGYDLNFTIDAKYLNKYTYSETCQDTIPQAINCFLQGVNFEHCIRLAVSLGGDADTLACITGAFAGTYFDIPTHFKQKALELLPNSIKNILEFVNTGMKFKNNL